MQRAAVWILTLGIILSGNLLLPSWYARDLQLPQQGPRSKADVLLDVLGEARTVMARLLWFKMDLMHEQLDAKGIPHNQQTELMPYLRLITLLDHSIDEAYDIIADDLYLGDQKEELAFAILDEGLSYNPKSSKLLLRKALLLSKQERWKEVVPVADQGLASSTDSIDQRNFCRLGFHAEDRLGNKERAEHYLRVMFSVEPGDTSAAELWRQLNGSMPPHDIQYPGAQ